MNINCVRCKRVLSVPDKLAGKLVKCPCGQKQKAPSNSGAAPQSLEVATKPAVPPLRTPQPAAFPQPQVRPGTHEIPLQQLGKGISVASLVLGICSFFTCMGPILGIPAIVTGIVGMRRVARGLASGHGLALAGIVCGTLSSLLVPIIGLGFLLPALSAGKEAAARMNCSNNLKEIGLALHNYHAAYKQLPDVAIRNSQGEPLLSWRVELLPFLGHTELYERFHHDEPWDSPHNLPLAELMPEVFTCKSGATDLAPQQTVYMAPVNQNPPSQSPTDYHLAFQRNGPTRFRDMLDGLANTIMVLEVKKANAVVWTQPRDIDIDLTSPLEALGDLHNGGTHVLMADGACIFITNEINEKLLAALFTRAGKEIIEAISEDISDEESSEQARNEERSRGRPNRPSNAVMGHWRSVVDASNVRFPKWDFEVFIAPHQKGLSMTFLWADGTVKDEFYVIDEDNIGGQSLAVTRWFPASQTRDKREKLSDSQNWLEFDADGSLRFYSMVWETPVLTDQDKAVTPRIKQAYYVLEYIDASQNQ